ncbi:helix-turn-helix domain-containing protein [Saccharopolyspora mangrovi]|uniref:Helix-turn-helix transcriptional regulator n=1 Tax=Saccharopolyspora mangrovi TaxID=3082379 RepID=A0ABU6AEK8_9PSEU|nr:helix-turn-helix transcriptional regulator [Saccharopolyspora sp. S2-29]MEB3369981.1 helix-turn-helix transcriptional regulator [Saccharopolyspora sp. S2-29]
MVRLPLTPDQVESGARVGKMLRDARAGRDAAEIARAAGISPETLRKIESGRLPTPAFGTVVGLCDALDLPVHEVAEVWRSGASLRSAS